MRSPDDLLPLWVADMDFKLPEEILTDFHKRIDHGIFGYTDPDQEYYDALDRWFAVRHGYHVEPETVTVGCGVVYGLATGVKAFTKAGDSILIQQPVYYPFREVIEDNGRIFVNNQLHYEDGKYTIDFDDFEKKIIDNKVKVFILCNPHNPVGRVWTKEELEKMGDICLKHHVVIMDDEIHCDFIYPGFKFTSFMTLDEKYHNNLVLYTSPSKTFNVAGLQSANIIIKILVPGVFMMCCFISTAIGTSMGTMAAMAPVALGVAEGAGLNPAIVCAAVIGGSYFGDNLSMISDTTIAAAEGCGSQMRDKFRMNFFIALPAAILSLVFYAFVGGAGSGSIEVGAFDLFQIAPKRLVSLVDIFACAFLAVMPHDGGMLMTSEMAKISPFSILPYSVYPLFLIIATCVTI